MWISACHQESSFNVWPELGGLPSQSGTGFIPIKSIKLRDMNMIYMLLIYFSIIVLYFFPCVLLEINSSIKLPIILVVVWIISIDTFLYLFVLRHLIIMLIIIKPPPNIHHCWCWMELISFWLLFRIIFPPPCNPNQTSSFLFRCIAS